MVENREKKGVVFLVVILAIIIGVGVFIAATLRVDPVAETLKKEPSSCASFSSVSLSLNSS